MERGWRASTDSLSQLLVKHIVFSKSFLPNYIDLPIDLIDNGMNELGSMNGLELSKKLHSIFIEFLTFKSLEKNGYVIKNFIRSQGACDLIMQKNGLEYNFEVKFKENDGISISRLYAILDGYSLLQKNGFIRGEFIEINLKVENINFFKEEIINEISQYISSQNDIYDGEHLQIFNSKNRYKLNRDINSSVEYTKKFLITDELESIPSTKLLIKKLFIGEGRHITNLINKSKRIDDFVGCLSWSIPFHNNVNFQAVELSFRELLTLDFDLYIYLNHLTEGEYHFILKKQC